MDYPVPAGGINGTHRKGLENDFDTFEEFQISLLLSVDLKHLLISESASQIIAILYDLQVEL